MIRPGKLHHAALRVSDVERSKRFYESLLGLAAVERPDFGFPGAWYGLGEGQLHLIQSPKVSETIDPTDPHVAIEVEDFEATKQALRDQGIQFLDFATALWIHDPDGYTIELRQKG
jgi:catechol 2,3-dioxygenase-like lactoylglutathione lyase family enzyme